jgi:hypothetical protein
MKSHAETREYNSKVLDRRWSIRIPDYTHICNSRELLDVLRSQEYKASNCNRACLLTVRYNYGNYCNKGSRNILGLDTFDLIY